LLEHETEVDIPTEQARKITECPDLRNVVPGDVIPYLLDAKVITNVDRQEIEARCNKKGDIGGMYLLLDRMQCHLSPEEWYYEFLNVLRADTYDDKLEKLEPDFLLHPEKFSPTLTLADKGKLETFCYAKNFLGTGIVYRGELSQHARSHTHVKCLF